MVAQLRVGTRPALQIMADYYMCQDKQIEANITVSADMSVEDVMSEWSQTVDVFRRYNMVACISCMIAPFCAVGDAATIFNVPQSQFLIELEQVIGEQ